MSGKVTIDEKSIKLIEYIKSKYGISEDDRIVLLGKADDKQYVVVERIYGRLRHLIICVEGNLLYTVSLNSPEEIYSYKEDFELEDGENDKFEIEIQKDNNSYEVNRKISIEKHKSDDTSLIQKAGENELKEFEKKAQPAERKLEYACITGLPIVENDRDGTRRTSEGGIIRLGPGELLKAITEGNTIRRIARRMDENPISEPYVISIEFIEVLENSSSDKKIKFLYTSFEAYKKGKKPIMIYTEENEERENGESIEPKKDSNMYRLLDSGEYVDNNSFDPETGRFEKKSYEQIMKAMEEKMPSHLDNRILNAFNQGFEVPEFIQSIITQLYRPIEPEI